MAAEETKPRTPSDAAITLETIQVAFAESLLPPEPPTYAFHPDVMKDDYPWHELFTGLQSEYENGIEGLITGSIYNSAAVGITPMEPMVPLTIDVLMESYRQFEKLAKQDEDNRRDIRKHLYVFYGAPWEVVRAVKLVVHLNPLDIHPEEYKRAHSLVLAYLEDLSNASTR